MTRVTQVRQVTPLSAQLPSVARTKTHSALSVLKEACLATSTVPASGISGAPAFREELAELAGQWKERGERDDEKLKRMGAIRPFGAVPLAPATTAGLAQRAEQPVIGLRSEASAQGNAADPEPQLGVGDEVMLPK